MLEPIPEPKSFRQIAGTVAAAVLVVLFGYLGALVGKPFANQVLSRSWTLTDAIVLSSTVQQACSKPGSFTNVLGYEYVVDGRRFEGDSQSFGLPFCGHEDIARQRADSYRVGAHLQIRYDEEDPARSVLSGGSLAPGNYLYAAFFLLVLGTLIFKTIPQIRFGDRL